VCRVQTLLCRLAATGSHEHVGRGQIWQWPINPDMRLATFAMLAPSTSSSC